MKPKTNYELLDTFIKYGIGSISAIKPEFLFDALQDAFQFHILCQNNDAKKQGGVSFKTGKQVDAKIVKGRTLYDPRN